MNSSIIRSIFSIAIFIYILLAQAKDEKLPAVISDKLNNYLLETQILSEGDRLDFISPLKVSINDNEGWLVFWGLVEPSSMVDKKHRMGLFLASAIPENRGQGLVLSGLSTASIEEPDRFARLVGRVKALNKSESPTFFFLSMYTILSGSGSWTLATDLIVRLDPDTWAISVIKDFGVTGRFSRLNIELREFQNTSFTFEEVSPHEVILVKQSKDADQVIKQCFRVSDSSVSSLDCLIAEKNRNFKPLLRPFDEFLKPMINPVN